MSTLVYYAVGGGTGYYGMLRKSLTTLLRNYGGRVLVIADRDIRIDHPRVTVKHMPMWNKWDIKESRFWVVKVLSEFIGKPTILYLDVDTIITGSIEDLFSRCSQEGIYYALENEDQKIGNEWNGLYCMNGAELADAKLKNRTAYNGGVFLTRLSYAEVLFRQITDLFRKTITINSHLSDDQKSNLTDQSVVNTLVYRGVIRPLEFPPGLVGVGLRDTGALKHTILHFNGQARSRMYQIEVPENELVSISGL